MKPVQVGLLGLGTVGGGVCQVLARNGDEISRRAGRDIAIARAAGRNLRRDNPAGVDLTDDPAGVVNDPAIDVVAELMGDVAVILAPLIGYDSDCHRLGHGGGYYDRTLTSYSHAPRVIGVGYSCCGLATIHPQRHDVPMAAIVTESGVRYPHPRAATGPDTR